MRPSYSIIIPCFNEAPSLPILIQQIVSLNKKDSIEFILVDNGSSDSTEEIFNTDKSEGIVKVRLSENAGYGGGIKAGIEIAKGEYIGWTHADLQYSLIDSLNNLDTISKDVKFIKGKRRGRSISQNLLSANMSIFESILFGQILYDINAQPTIFHKDLLKYMPHIPDDFSIDLYTYVTAQRLKFKIFRFKVNFLKRNFGASSWNTGTKSIFKMSIRIIRYSLNLKKHL
jgi:glycosyltransferase involved in cell wall biosynthesis